MQNSQIEQTVDSGSLRELIDRYRPGFSLERPFYTDSALYQRDLQKVWNANWLWVGHVSQIPESGDYFLFEVGNESIIVVRDRNDTVRAHFNVCRHRGSRVCLNKSGNAKVFTCPYHAWTFSLDGELRGGRQMPDDFDRRDYALFPVSLRIFQGLIFICLSDNPPDIDAAMQRMAPKTEHFGFDNLKVAHEASYPVPANWKLAIENYLECYHCAPSHQEYSRSHSLKDPAEMTPELVGAMQERSKSAGLPIGTIEETGSAAEYLGSDIYCRRYPLFPGYDTGSRDGEALAPLLGEMRNFDGGATDVQIGPLNNFLVYSDHAVGYRFIPTGLQSTDIQTVWMVRGDAEEGRDYDLDRLTWLWHVTTLDDERIIRHNQEGVNSLHYRPGPLSNMEWGIGDFHHNYLKMIA